MRVIIAHNAVTDSSAPDEKDVLFQVEAVRGALAVLGHEILTVACSLDLAEVKCRLEQFRPDIVCNLVEDLDGQGRLAHLFPALLDAMAVAYTGSPTMALLATTHKIMAKEIMTRSGLRTPPWHGPLPLERLPFLADNATTGREAPFKNWVVKSVWEHASFGLDEDGLVSVDAETDLPSILSKRARRLGGACFAEAYIDGREFNLSVLAGPEGPQVLPPAEIIFEGYGEDKPRIVGYRAKWDADSYEFHHTPRSFAFPPEDTGLLEQLKADAVTCWRLFGLGGYARVDFRVDRQGNPWILEANTNPCLSPDAGFAAAVKHAGLTFPQAMSRILEDGLRNAGTLSNRH